MNRCNIFVPLSFILQIDVTDEIQNVADVDGIRLDDLYRKVQVIEDGNLFPFFLLFYLFIDGKILALEILVVLLNNSDRVLRKLEFIKST